jgi:hypothetical protein
MAGYRLWVSITSNRLLLVNAGMSGKSWLDIGLVDQHQSSIGIRSVQSVGNFYSDIAQ